MRAFFSLLSSKLGAWNCSGSLPSPVRPSFSPRRLSLRRISTLFPSYSPSSPLNPASACNRCARAPGNPFTCSEEGSDSAEIHRVPCLGPGLELKRTRQETNGSCCLFGTERKGINFITWNASPITTEPPVVAFETTAKIDKFPGRLPVVTWPPRLHPTQPDRYRPATDRFHPTARQFWSTKDQRRPLLRLARRHLPLSILLSALCTVPPQYLN
ncbi:hypothetical protein QBC39DRAFT_6522 [Podospora conica]|nr:hypothetical protein QBC39DRAFT_6522 [Schizothecium conicum]